MKGLQFEGKTTTWHILHYTCQSSTCDFATPIYLPSCSTELHSCGPISVSIIVQIFFQLIYILCHYHLFLQSIPSIYTLGKTYVFVSFKQIPFCIFFLCPIKYLASHFLLNIRSFLSVSFKLFINLHIVIVSSFFLLVLLNAFLLIFPHKLGLPNLAPSSILVVILCILSNFNTRFFLCGDHITSGYFSFGLIIAVIIFLITLSRK